MSDAEAKKIDDYELVAKIAAGNSSEVWEVRDAGGQSYAMKLLLPDAAKNAEQVGVLKHEAKVGQALEHPNFVHTIKFVKAKTHCYMLMELFRCPNLKAMLQNEPIAAQSRFGRLVEQLCGGLGFMHDKGWLHHDLKPDNILFSKGSELKLIDFSLSMRRQGGLGKVFAGKVKIIQGTRTYIAPETIQKKYPTTQSDMYSLGVALFEVLTGQPPFTAPNPNDLLKKHISMKPPEPSAFNSNVTPEADKVILRLLSKKPAHRPKDMAEVAAEFRSIKVFKVDPLELAAQQEEKQKSEGLGLDAKSRLDSRADAARTAAGVATPPKPQTRKPTAAALAAAAAHESKQKPAAPAQPAAAYPAGYPPAAAWPGYAPQPAQGYWPQYPPAGAAPPPAQPYYAYPQGPPAQYPPQQPAAPYGGYPPAGYPEPQASPQPAAGQPGPRPAAAQPAPPEKPRPAAANVQPAVPAAQRPSPQFSSPGQGRSLDERHPTQRDVEAEDIPLMDELPEVL